MTARENENQPCAVPLTELMLRVPIDARLTWTEPDGVKATHFVPVGKYLHEAANELLRLRTAGAQEWVDVRERLPKERGTYLATSTGSPWHDHILERPIVQLLYFDGSVWENDDSVVRTVTAWRVGDAPYLPPPPKGDAT